MFQCVWSVLPEGLLQISPVERGVVTLLGVRSGLFVAMNRRGKLYGSVSVRNDKWFFKSFDRSQSVGKLFIWLLA